MNPDMGNNKNRDAFFAVGLDISTAWPNNLEKRNKLLNKINCCKLSLEPRGKYVFSISIIVLTCFSF